MRSTDFPQYRQIDQRARNNDVASAPEFREERHICTIKYVLRTLHLGMAPGVSNRPSKKKNGTYCCRSIAYQVHKHVQVPGTCSFGLFNYDSFVSFRAIGVIWGIRELTAELVCLLFWSLFLVPTLWGTLLCPLPCYGTDNQRLENHLHVDCPGVGQVASVRGLPGSRAGCTGLTNRVVLPIS